MKKTLIGFILCLIIACICNDAKTNIDTNISEYFLPYDTEWKVNKDINNITVKSTYRLYISDIIKIRGIYKNSKDIFFNDFENISCDQNNLGYLQIKVIEEGTLRNKKYFRLADTNDFGRYFRSYNTIYITYDMFSHHEYLAHELAHYFYDECGIKFKDDDHEHVKVYKFQKLYKEKCTRIK